MPHTPRVLVVVGRMGQTEIQGPALSLRGNGNWLAAPPERLPCDAQASWFVADWVRMYGFVGTIVVVRHTHFDICE